MKTTIIQLSDLQLVDIIGDASRLELTDESFQQLLSKLEYTGRRYSPAYEYSKDDGVHDYGIIINGQQITLTIWNGQKYVDVEFTDEQLEKLAELVYTPWT